MIAIFTYIYIYMCQQCAIEFEGVYVYLHILYYIFKIMIVKTNKYTRNIDKTFLWYRIGAQYDH